MLMLKACYEPQNVNQNCHRRYLAIEPQDRGLLIHT